MELGTFGALLGFALDLESKIAAFYETVAVSDSSVWTAPLQGSRRRSRQLELARREGVSEMILEAISGLDSEDYLMTLDFATKEPIQQAIALVGMLLTKRRFQKWHGSSCDWRGRTRNARLSLRL